MCSILIGYKNWWIYNHQKIFGQMSRGILGTCGNYRCLVLQDRFAWNIILDPCRICTRYPWKKKWKKSWEKKIGGLIQKLVTPPPIFNQFTSKTLHIVLHWIIYDFTGAFQFVCYILSFWLRCITFNTYCMDEWDASLSVHILLLHHYRCYLDHISD